MPPPATLDAPIIFIEVQFHLNPKFYWEFLCEIFLFLNQQQPEQDWIGVAIFPSRNVDVSRLSAVQQEMVNCGRLVRVYLDELPPLTTPEFGLLRLMTCPPSEAVQVVSGIRGQTPQAVILDLVETILVYKFPQLSQEEIERMFTLDDLRQTRVFQEATQEGELKLLMKLIKRKFGELSSERTEQIQSLSIEQLEALGEALLDWTTVNELYQWLDRRALRSSDMIS